MLVVHFWGPITGFKIPKTARIVEGTTASFRVVFGILKPVPTGVLVLSMPEGAELGSSDEIQRVTPSTKFSTKFSMATDEH
jgi:hypothetical protein